MKAFSKSICAAALCGLVSISAIVPASAQSSLVQAKPDERDRVVTTFCSRHSNLEDCRDYRSGRWDRRDYDRFYRRHNNDLDNIASGLFGFTFGAIIGGAIANSQRDNDVIYLDRGSRSNAHIRACYDRYRSYDVETDTYLGYDGIRHPCRL
ncbi:hypothetical protein GCM10007989_35700 [Devosia pacifica]|uniref:Lectin-like protein BA14k n=1 Tax=Devosia pacifica TaxID=1335967 RepID=A0A918VY65_9HYPH|nr:BA14K family protein [Devosia pacifica]GHA36432.1 hypothetical protein GCM10007989_35700 [Devosia pacifica]